MHCQINLVKNLKLAVTPLMMKDVTRVISVA